MRSTEPKVWIRQIANHKHQVAVSLERATQCTSRDGAIWEYVPKDKPKAKPKKKQTEKHE